MIIDLLADIEKIKNRDEDDAIYYSIISFSSRATLEKMDVESECVEVIYTKYLLHTIKNHTEKN
jgi:hypothetical protein